jgi:hypothetical protein
MADVKKLIEMFEAKAKAKPGAKVVDVPPLEKSGAGTALASDVRTAAETAFGKDFSKVRIHEDASVAKIGAKAYVSGNDIVFAPGASKDNNLLAHELWHVVQQGGRVQKGKGVI